MRNYWDPIERQLALTVGSRLGHYNVTALTGGGRMGFLVAVRPIR